VKVLAMVLAACAALAAGCGGDDDSNDKRATALECLRDDRGLDARLAGRDAIQVGDGEKGPRIRFFLTSGEAEAAQFEGRQEGTEHIGSALLFVRQGSDQLLEDVESCLDSL
jgi:hypothetical protein